MAALAERDGYQQADEALLTSMVLMTPGLAAALTPHYWTPRQLERRERRAGRPQPRTARVRISLPRPHRRHAVG